ncbi:MULTISPECIES: (2Fe-2S)-binding protein [unclassified Streptomyces]|uniref:(2Fe-2S)-binding protein n=1 Tax=unclassified Streptomyces TaxID=2593676 RepID=UPI0006FA9EFC|nr:MULTISPECIES: (2Fe-2S)-binding protein [unclassified Streptomyces]KQX52695.1 xanthine dehydrogenase [Streptomyces sp. Root1304]KRA89610.1 xanthine dehydrogenase [Streptomyces sp. Root66D1]
MSSNEEQHRNPGGWEPIPQSEGYDGDATAFVQLPPDFMLDGVPLEAPGHGYVPPMITPLQPLTPTAATDPAATGSWTVHLPTQAEQTQYFDGNEYVEGTEQGFGGAEQGTSFPGAEQERFRPPAYVDRVGHPADVGRAGEAGHAEYLTQDPHATAEWRFTEAAAPAVDPGATGQWSIPVVPDQVVTDAGVPEAVAPDAVVPGVGGAVEGSAEQGEFAAAPVRPYAEAPATLPGGAPAPWALPEEPVAETVADEEPAEEPAEAVEDADADTAATDADAHVVDGGETPDEPGAPDPDSEPAPPEDVVEPAAGVAFASTDSDEHPHTSYTLRVNGADRPVTGSWIGESLLYVLRERLGLAGAKDGCSQGECGACNVQVDGRLVASCLVPAATAAGSEVRTVEGLAVDGEPSDVQRAMAKCGTVQCGFCIPGMCMTVHDLLEGNHAPTELEARQALAGNLCRCSGYRGVLEAVRDVVAEREASAAATAHEGSDEPRVPHQIPHAHDGGMA